MYCLLCKKELEGDYQLCPECFVELTKNDPLWHCKGFSVGESVPDLLAKESIVVLSLSKEGKGLTDEKTIEEDVTMPENPDFEDAEKIFWKINNHMKHMGIGTYLEDAKNLELTVNDLLNLSHMLKIAEDLVDFKGAAEEETLSRISTTYFYAYLRMDIVKGVDAKTIKKGKRDLYSLVSRYTKMAESVKPSKGIAELNRGFLHIHLHRYKDAVAHFKRVRDFEKKPRVLSDIGLAFEGMEMYEEADEYYTKALKIDEKCIKAWMGRASVALYMRKWGAALQFASKAISLDPNLPEAYILEGDIFLNQGLYAEADKAYERAIKLRGGDKGWLKRASGMFRAGRWGAALQFIDRYLFIFPNDHEGWVMKARILREKGDREEAKKAYKRALEIKNTSEIREEMKNMA